MKLKQVNAIGILAVLFFSMGCKSSQNTVVVHQKTVEEWKVVKVDKSDTPTWKISRREIQGTRFMEYKIEGSIDASPEACMASFKNDLYDQAKDHKRFPVYDFVEDTMSILTYVIHEEPWPLKNTEMSIRYNFFREEAGSTAVRWKEAWDECPIEESKKFNRIQTFRGSWEFDSIGVNRSSGINLVQFELIGQLLWFAEPMVTGFLKKGLQYIRDNSAKQNVDD